MQHHDPQTQNPENAPARDVARRDEEDGRDKPTRHAASLHDLPSGQAPGSTRKFYEF